MPRLVVRLDHERAIEESDRLVQGTAFACRLDEGVEQFEGATASLLTGRLGPGLVPIRGPQVAAVAGERRRRAALPLRAVLGESVAGPGEEDTQVDLDPGSECERRLPANNHVTAAGPDPRQHVSQSSLASVRIAPGPQGLDHDVEWNVAASDGEELDERRRVTRRELERPAFGGDREAAEALDDDRCGTASLARRKTMGEVRFVKADDGARATSAARAQRAATPTWSPRRSAARARSSNTRHSSRGGI